MKYLLKDKWDLLFIKLDPLIGGSLNFSFSEITFELLFNNYFYDENRYYHNAQHIKLCLENMYEMIEYYNKFEIKIDWLAIELGIWFHDFIYDTRKNNNEELSGLFAKQFILGIVGNLELAERVESLILFTKHDKEAKTMEEKIISDLDLYVFADYGYHDLLEDGHVDKIRKEYNWVPDWIYYPQRVKILEKFLSRDKIYYTEYFADLYCDDEGKLNCEKTARENILKEINSIKKYLNEKH